MGIEGIAQLGLLIGTFLGTVVSAIRSGATRKAVGSRGEPLDEKVRRIERKVDLLGAAFLDSVRNTEEVWDQIEVELVRERSAEEILADLVRLRHAQKVREGSVGIR